MKLIVLGLTLLASSGTAGIVIPACASSQASPTAQTMLRDQALRAGLESARLAVAMLEARSGELTAAERETLGRARRALELAERAFDDSRREQCAVSLRDAIRHLTEIVQTLPGLPPELRTALTLAHEVTK